MARSVITPILLSLLVGCADSQLPPLTANNPASPSAPEAVGRPARYTLGTDAATQRTRQLIAERAQQDSGTQPQNKENQGMPGMQNMPGMQDDH